MNHTSVGGRLRSPGACNCSWGLRVQAPPASSRSTSCQIQCLWTNTGALGPLYPPCIYSTCTIYCPLLLDLLVLDLSTGLSGCAVSAVLWWSRRCRISAADITEKCSVASSVLVLTDVTSSFISKCHMDPHENFKPHFKLFSTWIRPAGNRGGTSECLDVLQ